jgi:DNA-binding NarL/FixJ family response regulator
MDDLLSDLLETLDLLLAQAQAYQRALPPENYAARAAVDTLGELSLQARAQALDVQQSLEGRPGDHHHPLSPREMEVLQHAARGLTNKQIAYRLHLSERTIQHHLRSVFNKTGTNSRTEAVALALYEGWLQL